MEAKRTTTLTELEERLAGTDGIALRRQLITDLAALELRLVNKLAAMVPKPEYEQLTASVEAVRAAQKVLTDWVPGTARAGGRLQ
jgi:hypothetical protein